MVPHDFASDTQDIINPDLLGLIYNDKAVYESLCNEPREDFSFKFVSGAPGCGKSFFMLKYIAGKEESRFGIVAHSNLLEIEMASRMQEKGDSFTLRKIYFLGKSLVGHDLPLTWTVMTPSDMHEQLLREIAEDDGVVVIGTVKKMDDLRRRGKEFGIAIRFPEILHDEFARQTWLEFFTIAKIADYPGRYHVLGDQKQTKATSFSSLHRRAKRVCKTIAQDWRFRRTCGGRITILLKTKRGNQMEGIR